LGDPGGQLSSRLCLHADLWQWGTACFVGTSYLHSFLVEPFNVISKRFAFTVLESRDGSPSQGGDEKLAFYGALHRSVRIHLWRLFLSARYWGLRGCVVWIDRKHCSHSRHRDYPPN